MGSLSARGFWARQVTAYSAGTHQVSAMLRPNSYMVHPMCTMLSIRGSVWLAQMLSEGLIVVTDCHVRIPCLLENQNRTQRLHMYHTSLLWCASWSSISSLLVSEVPGFIWCFSTEFVRTVPHGIDFVLQGAGTSKLHRSTFSRC